MPAQQARPASNGLGVCRYAIVLTIVSFTFSILAFTMTIIGARKVLFAVRKAVNRVSQRSQASAWRSQSAPAGPAQVLPLQGVALEQTLEPSTRAAQGPELLLGRPAPVPPLLPPLRAVHLAHSRLDGQREGSSERHRRSGVGGV